MGLALSLPACFGAAAVDGLEHGVLVADVGAHRDAHAALQHAGEVGDDVAEHVRRDAHVVPLGLLDEPLRERVDDGVVLLDVRVLARRSR